jgi:hypothetical protein
MARALAYTIPKVVPTLKRKIGYADEELGEARTRLNEMNIDK